MEDILASIRRIIADDQSMPGHTGSQPAPSHETPGELPMASEAGPEVRRSAAFAEPPIPMLTAPSDLPAEQGMVATPQNASSEEPDAMHAPHPLAPSAPEVAGKKSDESDMPTPAEGLSHEVAFDEQDLHEAALDRLHGEPSLDLHKLANPEPFMSAHDVPEHDVPGEEARGLFSAATSQSLAAAFNTLAVSRLAEDSQELRGLAQDMLRPLLKNWLDENLPSMVEGIIRDEIDRMSRRGR